MFYKTVAAVVGFLLRIFMRLDVKGLENVPKSGSVVLCANHSSIMDPVLIIILLKRRVHFVGKTEIFKNKLFAAVLRKMCVFPVDRNINDIKAVKNCLAVLKSGEILGIFPEGTRTRERIPAHSGGVGLAVKTGSPVLPVYVGCKKGFLLFAKVPVRIGQPQFLENPHGGKFSKEQLDDLADKVMDDIYAMKP